MIRSRLFRLAWPSYECELCVGQEWHQGCYCAYYEAPGPCQPTEWWRVLLRRIYNFGWRNSLSSHLTDR